MVFHIIKFINYLAILLLLYIVGVVEALQYTLHPIQVGGGAIIFKSSFNRITILGANPTAGIQNLFSNWPVIYIRQQNKKWIQRGPPTFFIAYYYRHITIYSSSLTITIISYQFFKNPILNRTWGCELIFRGCPPLSICSGSSLRFPQRTEMLTIR